MARRRARGRPPKSPIPSLDPKLTGEIGAIVLGLLGLVLLLALVGQGGTVGVSFAQFARSLFGSLSLVIPFVLLFLAYSLLRPGQGLIRGPRLIGLVLLLLFIPGLLHLIAREEFALSLARAGRLGGLVGFVVSEQLRGAVGEIGAWLVSLAGLSVGLVLAAQVSIRELFASLGLRPRIGSSGPVMINQPKVSVFQTIKRSLSPRAAQAPALEPEEPGPPRAVSEWQLPPLELLETNDQVASSGNITKNLETVQKTLKQFGIDVQMQDVNIGPTVTQYTLKPQEGVKLNQITARAQDLALALAAKSLRIEAPIPGKGVVGIEIPNKIPAKVTLRELLTSSALKGEKSSLAVGLGLDVAGSPLVVDLEKMPHLLIAGATGSGKSVAINSILLQLLYRNTPEDLRLLMIDPKRVELTNFNGLPHLLAPVVTEPQKTINALKWTVAEMERRYQLFHDSGRRNIGSYNHSPPDGQLPYIVVVVDELADLMAVASADVEASIVRLAQLARATGIHLIVATQRPSVDVLTGLIKANITARIAFAVASQVDSRTILDMGGAEKLLGRGDMLYISAEQVKPKRIQGVLPSDKEINKVIAFIKDHNSEAVYDESILEYRAPSQTRALEAEEEDSLFDEAVEVVTQSGKASATLLQRRLKVGYARAARLLDLLEEAGIVGPGEGAKPREVRMRSFDRPIFRREGPSLPPSGKPPSVWRPSAPGGEPVRRPVTDRTDDDGDKTAEG